MIRCQTIDHRLQTKDLENKNPEAQTLKSGLNPFVLFFVYCLLSIVYSLMPPVCFAEMSFEEAESKATEAHKLAESDMIYQEQDWKALYYQNEQMISLLKDIKSELKMLNARSAKDDTIAVNQDHP